MTFIPNPVKDHLRIGITKEFFGTGNLSFYDVSGKIVLTKIVKPLTESLSLDISKYSPGLCFVILTNETGKIIEKEKLVINR